MPIKKGPYSTVIRVIDWDLLADIANPIETLGVPQRNGGILGFVLDQNHLCLGFRIIHDVFVFRFRSRVTKYFVLVSKVALWLCS